MTGIIAAVATREGGVDRNDNFFPLVLMLVKSPPARVAWIETDSTVVVVTTSSKVATREGGVDRNSIFQKYHPV